MGTEKAKTVGVEAIADMVGKDNGLEGLGGTKMKAIVKSVLSSIQVLAESGQRVTIQGYGSFSVVTRKARKGRNPHTGEAIDIPMSKVFKFSAAKKSSKKKPE